MKPTTVLFLLPLALPITAAAQVGAGNRATQLAAQLEQRFATADADHNGQLTRDEAKAGMPRVYQRFDEIDSSKKGYVTLDDIRAVLLTRMSGRGATGSTGQPQ
jgi:hypothetical protein